MTHKAELQKLIDKAKNGELIAPGEVAQNPQLLLALVGLQEEIALYNAMYLPRSK